MRQSYVPTTSRLVATRAVGLALRLDLRRQILAQAIHVPMNRISAIVNGKRGITGDTALRLARYWGTTPEYWMNLQSHYELELAKDAVGSEVSAIKHRSAAA